MVSTRCITMLATTAVISDPSSRAVLFFVKFLRITAALQKARRRNSARWSVPAFPVNVQPVGLMILIPLPLVVMILIITFPAE